ncbi:hypothetical protein ABTN58_19610, partial [Acinetobacter baumannii]
MLQLQMEARKSLSVLQPGGGRGREFDHLFLEERDFYSVFDLYFTVKLGEGGGEEEDPLSLHVPRDFLSSEVVRAAVLRSLGDRISCCAV